MDGWGEGVATLGEAEDAPAAAAASDVEPPAGAWLGRGTARGESCDVSVMGAGAGMPRSGGADDLALMSMRDKRLENRTDWYRIIDAELIEWGRDPERFEDDGKVAPTRVAIATAYQLARAFGAAGLPPPTDVVPTGDGGVALERRVGERHQIIEVKADGVAELLTFRGSRLESRKRFGA